MHKHALRQRVTAYITLCKLRVVVLMMITTLVGMCLATHQMINWHVLLFGNLGIALAASSAAAINHVIDRDLDRKMKRTQRRPLVSGEISSKQAYVFAAALCCLGMFFLFVFVNRLTAVLTFMTLIGYALIYTVYLKHATSQNIVIGGLAGAAPPLLGWVAVTGHIDPQALLLVLVIFVWTPPHFWALAIYRVDDYAKANVPMLPNTHGIAYTKLSITLYTFLLIAVSILPYAVGMLHNLYLFGAILLNLVYLYYNMGLQFSSDVKWAINSFRFSIVYLFLLFIIMLLDHFYYPVIHYFYF